MINLKDFSDDLFLFFEEEELYNMRPPELESINNMLRISTDPYALSRKWFVYDDEEDEERYDEDW